MPREITNHGQPGYRRGCRCGVCRKGHAQSVAAWRASKRQAKTEALPEAREPLVSAPALDMTAEPGPVESALSSELGVLVGDPPWRGTLSQMALYNARLLDQIARLDRLDLVSPIQLRTLEIFDRLRAVSQPAGPSVADAAAALLNDLNKAE